MARSSKHDTCNVIANAGKVLRRTATSIQNFVARGGHTATNRGIELADRYSEARHILQTQDHQKWLDYCAEIGADPKHNAYDLFA